MMTTASSASAPMERSFNPYTENGGTVLAISSREFAVVAGDTRQTAGYLIQTRNARKIFPLTKTTALAVTGYQADCNFFQKRLKSAVDRYALDHGQEMTLPAIARLVQQILYSKRQFPYYSWVILAGIDVDGTGAVYSYDPVGSYERESCRAAGAADALLQPFLDNMVYGKNQVPEPGAPSILDDSGRSNLPKDRVLALVKDAFTGATERHIEVGDALDIFVIDKEGIHIDTYPLKRD